MMLMMFVVETGMYQVSTSSSSSSSLAPSGPHSSGGGGQFLQLPMFISRVLPLVLVLFVDILGAAAEPTDLRGCRYTIQEGISSDSKEFKGKSTQSYVIRSLTMLEKISSQTCLPNVMYGHTMTSWWVKHGCVAKFKIEECLMDDCVIRNKSGSNPYLVPTHHPATPGFNIHLISIWEQTSFYSCDQGKTFHFNETMWWLDKGCEGKFQILECPVPPVDIALTATESTEKAPKIWSKTERRKGIIPQTEADTTALKHSEEPGDKGKSTEENHTHDMESSGNINPFTSDTKDVGTKADGVYQERSSSDRLIATLSVIAFSLGWNMFTVL